MLNKLVNTYSAVVKLLKGQKIAAEINEQVNLDRLKTMYFGYEGDREIEIKFIDPRRFTAEQRKFLFALIGDIYAYTGEPIESLKDYFYLKYEALTGSVISLADGSANTISDVTLLIDIVLDFIFENHIPFKSSYEILPANQEYYFYKCIVTRVCCICGKSNADIDHFSKALGRRNRKIVDHTKYDFAALCREHHTEKHQIGL
ncbi:putative HNHc nuclease, partial [Melissococcus plutonius]